MSAFPSPGYLVIRADAGSRIGSGHIMRCIALAQGWRRGGGDVIFVCAEITPSLEARLGAERFSVHHLKAEPGTTEDANRTIETFVEQRHSEPSWLVCDGYQFGGTYQRAIKAAGPRLLIMDDYGHAEHYSADLVLNQNLSAREELYENRASYTRLLLGTRYVLLRKQFLAYRNWSREIVPVACKVLVTLGGADPDNVTAKVIEVLSSLDVDVKVIVGGSNPHFENLKSKIENRRSKIELLVGPDDMPDLMAWADVAIAAGGTTSWELAFMGLPSLVFVLANNQRAVVDALDTARVSRKTAIDDLADDLITLLADAEGRHALSEHGRKLVDGLGVSRVLSHLRAGQLQLRPVHSEDCRKIWEWSNDPEARAVSVSQEAISWDDHVKWFSEHVNSPSCFFYLASNSTEKPIGQIRFDVNGDEAVLSVNLSKESRGHGYGSALIIHGAQRCFADSQVKLIRAFVIPANETSVRAFEKTDFVSAESVEQRGRTMRQFILKRAA